MSIPFQDPERREDLFGGSGVVLVEELPSALCAPFTVALHCELAGGGRVGAHVQQECSEIIVGLSGEAVCYVDGAARAVSPGAVVGLALGQTLEIDNASADVPFRYLIIKARP